MKKKYAIWAILAVGFILRLVNLNQSFWLDEAAQVIESTRPFSSQFQLAADFHPPLYHLILFFWMKAGHSEIWTRMLSVLLGTACIYFIYRIACSFKQEKAGLLAALFLAVSPYHIWYSQEVRPYMLFTVLSLFLTLLFFQKRWLLYTATLILGLYAHYFIPFLAAAHGIVIYYSDKNKFSVWFRCVFVALLAFLPWIPSFWGQLQVGTNGFFSGWTDVVSVTVYKAVPLTFVKFVLGKTQLSQNNAYLLLLVPMAVLTVFASWKCLKSKMGRLLVMLFISAFSIILCVSFLVPVIAAQRMLFLLPVFYLIIAVGIFELPRKWQYVGISLVLLVSVMGIADYFTNVNIQREQWRQAIHFLENGNEGNAAALFIFPEPFAPFIWYSKNSIEGIGVAPKFAVEQRDLDALVFKIKDKKKVFLFQYLTGLTDPAQKTRKFIQSLEFRETGILNYPGVGFIYVFDKS